MISDLRTKRGFWGQAMGRRTINTIGVLAVGVGIAAYFYFKDDITQFWDGLHVKVAEYPQPKKTVWLDQNVSKEKLSWFYHADQGTRTFGIPYEWFMALEQPTVPPLIVTSAGPLSDPAYLDRHGFIPDTIIPGKKAPLPIGFAQGGPMLDPSGGPWRNPTNKRDMTGIGLTCAACHTGRFTYKDTAVVIDGGPALTDLFKFKQGVGVALLYTRILPGRFSRFADRILGPDSTVEERQELKFQIDQVLNQYKQVKDLEQVVASQSIEEGYGRLDALNRIGNQVFSQDLNKPENYRGSSAPVHYPRIWNTPWFDWVQYNGSIMQPMVRNAGESLGVSSELNLTDPAKGLFKSSVNVDILHDMEQMIAGNPPSAEKGFSGLKSPKWPSDILPAIDEKLAAQGAELYKTTCQPCHRPPVSSPAFFDFSNKEWWTKNQADQPIVVVENIPISHVGTDPAQAADMGARTVELPANLDIKETSFAKALKFVVEKTVNYIYDRQNPPLSEKQRESINGNMPNEVRGELAYKVRSLNGIWATPPYLHNGSVPTIEDLLGPAADRPKTFYLGNREYDPVKLGYKTDKLTNGFEFDASIRGNSNRGHEFTDDEKTYGRVGPALDADKRRALIEYLKTL
jgi:mono/diheme cytochrome c family protein